MKTCQVISSMLLQRGHPGNRDRRRGKRKHAKAVVDALSRAAQKGVVMVRASRVPTGYVGRNVEVDDDKLNFVGLTPHKARVFLRLALMKGMDSKEIQKLFNTY